MWSTQQSPMKERNAKQSKQGGKCTSASEGKQNKMKWQGENNVVSSPKDNFSKLKQMIPKK